MKIVIAILIFFNFSYSMEKIEMGVLYKKLFFSKKTALVGKKVWYGHMKDKPLTKYVDMVLYEDGESLIKKYFNEYKVGMILINPTLYYKHKKILDENSEFIWYPKISTYEFEQYYLIKNKDAKFTFKDIKNMKIIFRENIGKVWLESLFLKEFKSSFENKNNILVAKNQMKLVYEIFFHKNELSVVSKSSYEKLLQLNPQIKNKIEILKKSEAIFVKTIGLVNKNLNQKTKDILSNSADDINKSSKEYKIFDLVKIKKIYEIDEKKQEFIKLKKFYDEYFYLKNLYK